MFRTDVVNQRLQLKKQKWPSRNTCRANEQNIKWDTFDHVSDQQLWSINFDRDSFKVDKVLSMIIELIIKLKQNVLFPKLDRFLKIVKLAKRANFSVESGF